MTPAAARAQGDSFRLSSAALPLWARRQVAQDSAPDSAGASGGSQTQLRRDGTSEDPVTSFQLDSSTLPSWARQQVGGAHAAPTLTERLPVGNTTCIGHIACIGRARYPWPWAEWRLEGVQPANTGPCVLLQVQRHPQATADENASPVAVACSPSTGLPRGKWAGRVHDGGVRLFSELNNLSTPVADPNLARQPYTVEPNRYRRM